MSAMQPSNPELRFEDPYLSAISADFVICYLQSISANKQDNIRVGLSLQEDLFADLNNEVGEWPYVFGRGGLFAKANWDHKWNKHQFIVGLGFPIVPVLIDMPYNQIPRVQGEPPGIRSVFKEGIQIRFLHSYQQVDIDLRYEYSVARRWLLFVSYSWGWYHDTKPRNSYAYTGKLTTGMNPKW